jgi:hypothetical protein
MMPIFMGLGVVYGICAPAMQARGSKASSNAMSFDFIGGGLLLFLTVAWSGIEPRSSTAHASSVFIPQQKEEGDESWKVVSSRASNQTSRLPTKKTKNPDGSTDLVFSQQRFSAGATASGTAGNLAFLLCIIPSCTVTSPVMAIGGGNWLSFTLWCIVSALLAAWLFDLVTTVKCRITVVPGQGLRFGGKQLPFTEVKELAVMTEQAAGRGGHVHATAYLFATAHGREIRLTKHISENLASTLLSEIEAASGEALS